MADELLKLLKKWDINIFQQSKRVKGEFVKLYCYRAKAHEGLRTLMEDGPGFETVDQLVEDLIVKLKK